MEIQNIQQNKKGNRRVLSAKVIPRGRSPHELYFSVPEEYGDFLTDDASPFLAAVLLPCMTRGEDILVNGRVSEQFLANARKIMETFCTWSQEFRPVSISAREVNIDKYDPSYTGCFFSGGVDSFYTFLKNKESITHLIVVHGFDIYVENKNLFGNLFQNMQKVAQAEGIKAIPVETNIRAYTDAYISWDWEVGGGLGSVALALRAGIQQFFIASTYSWDQMRPYGTHPATDSLWASKTMRIVHDGNEARRVEKVLNRVALSKTALQYLKVCYQNPMGAYNCSKCEKCIRTMLALEAAGAFHEAKTFDGILTPERVRNARAHGLGCSIHMEDNLEVLRARKVRPDLQEAIHVSIERARHPSLWTRTVRAIGRLDARYNKSRLYKFLYALNSGSHAVWFSKMCARLGILQ